MHSQSTPRLVEHAAQAERTALSWQRTGFRVLLVGALLAHTGQIPGHVDPEVAALVVIALGTLLSTLVPTVRYRRIVADIEQGHTPASRLAAFLGCASVSLAVLGGCWLAIG